MKLLDTNIDFTLNTSGEAALEIRYKGDRWYTVSINGKWDSIPPRNEYAVRRALEEIESKFSGPFMTAREAEAVALAAAIGAGKDLAPKPALYKIMGVQVYTSCPVTWANDNRDMIKEFLDSLVPEDCSAGYMGLSQFIKHPLYSCVMLVAEDGEYRAQPYDSRDSYDVTVVDQNTEQRTFNILPASNSGEAVESACSRLESGEYLIFCQVHNGSVLREEEVIVYV